MKTGSDQAERLPAWLQDLLCAQEYGLVGFMIMFVPLEELMCASSWRKLAEQENIDLEPGSELASPCTSVPRYRAVGSPSTFLLCEMGVNSTFAVLLSVTRSLRGLPFSGYSICKQSFMVIFGFLRNLSRSLRSGVF